jgi:multiple antibiotic resistance protein
MRDIALTAFANFIVILDPIGVVPFFITLTVGFTPAERRLTALKSVAIATVILLIFTVIGRPLLHYLGITLAAFRVAGGLLLFLLAIDMVLVKGSGIRSTTPKEDEEATHRRPDVATFPLAIPLIAGPGAIASVILLQGQRTGDPTAQIVTAGVMVGVLMLTALSFMTATRIMNVLGLTGINVMTRVLGIILAALAVNNVIEGVRASFPALGS